MSERTRREFLKGSIGTLGITGLGFAASVATPASQPGGPAALPVSKGLVWGMLPKDMSVADRMKTARDAGFEEVEAYTEPDPRVAEDIKDAADAAGIRIHSVMNQAH